MVRAAYVYPNLQESQGDLPARWCEAELLGCSCLAVPAGFVQSPVVKRKYGEFLTGSSLETLYGMGERACTDLCCMFQTDSGCEPSVLRWHDPAWVHRYVRMLAEIADCIGTWPDRIEIIPGKWTITDRELAGAMVQIRKEWYEMSGKKPDVLLENMPLSSLHSGVSLDRFWRELTSRFPSHVPGCGIALDVSGILAAAKKHRVSAIASLYAVPPEAVRGFHIHQAHCAVDPGKNHGFWRELRTIFREVKDPVYVVPEVLSRDDLVQTLGFCREYLFGEITPAVPGYQRAAPRQ